MPVHEPDNTPFLDAMRVIATSNTPDTRQTLYETMLSSVFYLPSPDDDSPEGIKLFSKGESLHIITIHLSDRKVAWPVFTDMESMFRWKRVTHYYQFDAIDTFALADKHEVDTVLINPAGPIGGQVTRWELRALAMGEIPDPEAPRMSTRALDRADIFAAPPAQVASDKMISVTRDVMTMHPEVQSAYIFMMALDPQPPQLVLGIRLYEIPEKPAKDAMMRTLSKEVNDQLAPEKLGLIVLTDKLYNMAAEGTSPVFER